MPPIPSRHETTGREYSQKQPMRIGLKILFMALITTGLMIPDLIIYGLSSEREDNQKETVSSISQSWGGRQLVSGPILSVPYSYERDKEKHTGIARILPSRLDAKGTVDSKVLTRSIYETTVYNGSFDLEGDISLDELDMLGIPREAFQLDKATVTVGVGDLKGLESLSEFVLGGKDITLNGTNDHDIYTNDRSYNKKVYVSSESDDFTAVESVYPTYGCSSDGCLQAPVNLASLTPDSNFTAVIPFKFTMNLKGSQSIAIAPVGRENTITIDGVCKSPSFGGMFLPSDRSVKDDHFEAVWRLNSNNRDYPQAFDNNMSSEIAESAVVVNMLVPVDRYQKVDRTLKYAFLVIMLTFITILFCEIVARTPMHMFQYLLVGLSLILFYSLLLSLVEHMSFGLSYLIASLLTIGMVSVYVRGVLKSHRMALLTGGILALMYIFIYIVMCLETYALLTGSIGLFLALAAVMYVSLRIKLVFTD